MAEHKKITEKNQEKVNRKHSVRRNEPETLFDRHAWEQAPFPITGTPFQPPMGAHAELLARAPSDEHRASLVKHLQQTYGNRYVRRLIESMNVQAKLTVSSPNDVYEQEADRVAELVTRGIQIPVSRQEEEEEEEEEEPLQTKPVDFIQRQAEEEEEEEEEEPLQTKPVDFIQRQAEEEEEEEEEEPLQTKPVDFIQHQEEEEEEEEEEPLQTKPVDFIQRQAEEEEEEEEEPLQTKPVDFIQHQEEEEEVQTKPPGSQPAMVSENLENRIKAAQGGGHPLSDVAREPMEQAFKADFSGVRVHTDSEADALNKQLSAKAFTTGQDIFFREGEYSPGSDSGRKLIAHELTHVVQQTGGETAQGQTKIKRGSTPLAGLRRMWQGLIQRLAFMNTRWEDTTKASVSESGAGGVIFMRDDGEPLVVKPGEILPQENIMAAKLFGGVFGQSKQEGKWSVGTPRVRLALLDEAGRIKKAATKLWVVGGRWVSDREQNALDKLDQPTTVVFSYASGKDFSHILENIKHTKKRKFRWWKRKERETMLTRLWKDSSLMTTLGKASAVDIFMGNFDRVVGKLNTQNWRVIAGQRAMQLIDNVEDRIEDQFVNYPGEKGMALKAFTDWLNMDIVKWFNADNYSAISKYVLEDLMQPQVPKEVRGKDRALVKKRLEQNEPQMRKWFENGLREGKDLLLRILNDPLPLVKGVSEQYLLTALTSVIARRMALRGAGVDCWTYAEYLARAYLIR